MDGSHVHFMAFQPKSKCLLYHLSNTSAEMGYVFDDSFIANHPVKHEIVMPFHKVDTVIPHRGSKRLVIIQRPTARRAHQVDYGRPEIGLGTVRWLLAAIVEYAT